MCNMLERILKNLFDVLASVICWKEFKNLFDDCLTRVHCPQFDDLDCPLFDDLDRLLFVDYDSNPSDLFWLDPA